MCFWMTLIYFLLSLNQIQSNLYKTDISVRRILFNFSKVWALRGLNFITIHSQDVKGRPLMENHCTALAVYHLLKWRKWGWPWKQSYLLKISVLFQYFQLNKSALHETVVHVSFLYNFPGFFLLLFFFNPFFAI